MKTRQTEKYALFLPDRPLRKCGPGNKQTRADIHWFLNRTGRRGDRSEAAGAPTGNLNVIKALALRSCGFGIKSIAKRCGLTASGFVNVRAAFVSIFGQGYQLPSQAAAFNAGRLSKIERTEVNRLWAEGAKSRAVARAEERKRIRAMTPKVKRVRPKQHPTVVAFQCANRQMRKWLRRRTLKHMLGTRNFDLVGCTRTEFVHWIQSQFGRGMTWANYGRKWHIDHRVPLYRFDLSREDHRRAASHYTNLRPLLVEHNIKRRHEFEEMMILHPDNPWRHAICAPYRAQPELMTAGPTERAS
jgi:hypothetical protein